MWYAKLIQSCLTLCNPMDCSLPGFFVHEDSPGKNTGVGCHFLLQEIFLIQRSKPHLLCLLHWQVVSLPLAPVIMWCEIGLSPYVFINFSWASLSHTHTQNIYIYIFFFSKNDSQFHWFFFPMTILVFISFIPILIFFFFFF